MPPRTMSNYLIMDFLKVNFVFEKVKIEFEMIFVIPEMSGQRSIKTLEL